jgi:hypothetical protein
MEINLLYFDGCPSWKRAMENLQTAAKDEKMEISINLIEVKSDQDAAEIRFLGSPSFQVKGEDFWPQDRKTFSMSCRVYRTSEGFKGWPTVEMLRLKLLEINKKD